MMGKKGQVTVFIIIGILIVAGIAITLYAGDYILTSSFDREKSKVSVVDEFQPMYSYFESCLHDIGMESVILLGQQGGKIDVPIGDPLLDFTDSLDVFDNDALRVPYWFFQSENGVQNEDIPELEEMQAQIEKYVTERSGSCVANFTFPGYTFDGFYEVESKAEIKDDKVLLKINTPLTLKHDTVSQQIDTFFVTLDVPLGRLYKLSKDIYERQKVDLFFEKRTIDLLVVYDELPFLETDFSCDPKVWGYDQVRKDFKRILTDNLGAVKIVNSYVDTNDYFVLPVSGDVGVQFRYSDRWPLFLDIFPQKDGVLTGDTIVGDKGVQKVLNKFLCLQQYHFVYDIQYPLLVTLNDDDYVFQFATQIIIDNNQPRKLTVQPISVSQPKVDVCRYPITPVTVSSFTPDNDGTLLPLGDVAISFKCLTQTCDIGDTQLDESGGGSFDGLFPFCLNGMIIGEKEGYHTGKEFISTNSKQLVNMILEPLHEKQVEVKIIDGSTGRVRNIFSDEQVSLDFVSKEGHASHLDYPSSTNVELISDSYDVKARLLAKGEVVIGEDTVEHCVKVPRGGVLGFFLKTTKCVDNVLDEVVLDEIISGGVEFNWEFAREDLVDADKIIIYLIDNGVPENHEELGAIPTTIQQNKDNPYFMLPEFVYEN